MALLGANYRRDLEIHRYPLIVYALVPLVSLVLQAWLPRALGSWALFDLPFVVTVYFALGRRSPIQGTIMGALMGLFEDALTHHAIGLNGIAKTVVGYLAASVGIRIDVENLHDPRDAQLCALRSPALSIFLFTGFCWAWNWSGDG